MIRRIFYSIIESMIRNISGGLGQKIRYYYYKRKFKSCGNNIKIGIGVVLQGVENIIIGNNVWIDDYCILIAGNTGDMENREVKKLKNKTIQIEEGIISIGSNIHFAPFCIIHGFGGVQIDDYVGLSSGVKIYSMSNHYNSFIDKTKKVFCNPMVKDKPVVFVKSPIHIQENVFISINSIIFIGTIGKNSFISPNSIVTKNIPENTIASGNPAIKIRERFVK